MRSGPSQTNKVPAKPHLILLNQQKYPPPDCSYLTNRSSFIPLLGHWQWGEGLLVSQAQEWLPQHVQLIKDKKRVTATKGGDWKNYSLAAWRTIHLGRP